MIFEKLNKLKYSNYQNFLIKIAIKDISIYKKKELILPKDFDFNNHWMFCLYSKSGCDSYNQDFSLLGKKFFITLKLNHIIYHQDSLIDTKSAYMECYLKIAFDILYVSSVIDKNKETLITHFTEQILTHNLNQVSFIRILEEMQEFKNKSLISVLETVFNEF